LQTTGVLLDKEILNELRNLGITTISFSISNIFDNERNLELIGCPEKLKFNVFDIIKIAKELDFNIRLSLNLVNDFDKFSVEDVFERCKLLDVDQVTFRKLYKSESNLDIDRWIEKNSSIRFYDELVKYVKNNGKLLGVLPFNANVYNIDDISVCVDDDCMGEKIKDTYKYLILRENCKLYSSWNTKASLIF
jgi:hypothetical protein